MTDKQKAELHKRIDAMIKERDGMIKARDKALSPLQKAVDVAQDRYTKTRDTHNTKISKFNEKIDALAVKLAPDTEETIALLEHGPCVAVLKKHQPGKSQLRTKEQNYKLKKDAATVVLGHAHVKNVAKKSRVKVTTFDDTKKRKNAPASKGRAKKTTKLPWE